MNLNYFWLTDKQFAKLEPHLPADTRGKPRIDDRRVISGIIHVIKSGGRRVGAPAAYGPGKTLCNCFQRWATNGVWNAIFDALAKAGHPPAQLLIDSSAARAPRSAAGGKKGEHNQAICRSRGGNTTKIHALTDGLCRPTALLLTGGHVADCKAGEILTEQMPATTLLNADKGYDSDAIRHLVKERGAFANIPP